MGSIAEVKPFEGAEKLLEITFQWPAGCDAGTDSKHSDSEFRGLLSIDRAEYEKVLDKVNCSILNECRSNTITAYLLSESSLFIFADRLIVKTCGQTNLLNAIDDFIQLGSDAGMDSIAEIFYSRPNFINPDEQPFGHRKFKRETKTLLHHFNGGLSRVMGSTNSDCYHLFCYANCKSVREGCTLEVVMYNLADDRREKFFKNGDRTASDITQWAGFQSMFGQEAEVELDDYLFEPCGYSVNGLINKDNYFTVHVTPEKVASYASFETDLCDNVPQLVQQVLRVFRPDRFFISLISDQITHRAAHKELVSAGIAGPGYSRQEYQLAEFTNHTASYARFHAF